MSNKNNQEYLQRALETFTEYVAEKDWKSLSEMFLELKDQGFGHIEIQLTKMLTKEQAAEFRAWEKEITPLSTK